MAAFTQECIDQILLLYPKMSARKIESVFVVGHSMVGCGGKGGWDRRGGGGGGGWLDWGEVVGMGVVVMGE